MTTSAARRQSRQAGRTGKAAGRQAAHSPALRWLARAGLAARGVLYLIIGWIAVQIAFGQSSHQADQTGALRLLGRNPAGQVALWLLVIGFAASGSSTAASSPPRSSAPGSSPSHPSPEREVRLA